jgi:hypothetical protein
VVVLLLVVVVVVVVCCYCCYMLLVIITYINFARLKFVRARYGVVLWCLHCNSFQKSSEVYGRISVHLAAVFR